MPPRRFMGWSCSPMTLVGTATAIRVLAPGGEGPWYYAQGSPAVLHIPGCAVDDTIVAWAGTGPTTPSLTNCEFLVAYSTVSTDFIDYTMLLRCTDAGTIEISTNICGTFGYIIAHKTSAPAINGA